MERQADDLGAVGEDRADVLDGAPQRDHQAGVSLAQRRQVSRDRPGRDEEDPIGQVLGRQQGALAEGLLAEVGEAGLTKGSHALLVEQSIVLGAAVQRQADGLLLAIGHGLARRLIRGDGDQGDLAGRSHRRIAVGVGKIDFLDELEDRLGLKGRAVEAVSELVKELSIEGLGVESFERLPLAIPASHG